VTFLAALFPLHVSIAVIPPQFRQIESTSPLDHFPDTLGSAWSA